MVLTDLLSKEVFFGRKVSGYRFQLFLLTRQEENDEPRYDSYEFLKIFPYFSLVILIKMILIKNSVIVCRVV